MTAYIFIGLGLWLLFQSLRGTVSRAWNPGDKLKPGESMRTSTRVLYGVGGLMIIGIGILLKLR